MLMGPGSTNLMPRKPVTRGGIYVHLKFIGVHGPEAEHQAQCQSGCGSARFLPVHESCVGQHCGDKRQREKQDRHGANTGRFGGTKGA
ncbi:unnamed protein product [Calypogeia fissa]